MERSSYGEGWNQTERLHTETKDNIFHKTVHFYRGMNGVWVPSLIIDLFTGRMLSRLYLSYENGSGRQFNFRNGIALILFYSSDGLCCLERLFFPQSAIFHGYYFLPVIFHFAISAVPAWLFLTCFHWGQVSDLWVDDFFLSFLTGDFEKNREKFHIAQIIICSLEGWCCALM